MKIKELKKQIGSYSFTKKELAGLLRQINSGKEKWASFDNRGWYLISSFGRIKSVDRILPDGRHRKERFLMPQINRYGYLTIYINALKKNFLIHRLMAIYFIPNPLKKPHVNHTKGIKDRNILRHLEWSTVKENSDHAFLIGLRKKTPGGKENKLFGVFNNHFSKPIFQINKDTDKVIKKWPSAHEVKRVLGFNNKSISQCALGQRPTANGFKWKYKKQ